MNDIIFAEIGTSLCPIRHEYVFHLLEIDDPFKYSDDAIGVVKLAKTNAPIRITPNDEDKILYTPTIIKQN